MLPSPILQPTLPQFFLSKTLGLIKNLLPYILVLRGENRVVVETSISETETKTETRGCRDRDRDQEQNSRPRPTRSETETEYT